jgi:hypothetical protein
MHSIKNKNLFTERYILIEYVFYRKIRGHAADFDQSVRKRIGSATGQALTQEPDGSPAFAEDDRSNVVERHPSLSVVPRFSRGTHLKDPRMEPESTSVVLAEDDGRQRMDLPPSSTPNRRMTEVTPSPSGLTGAQPVWFRTKISVGCRWYAKKRSPHYESGDYGICGASSSVVWCTREVAAPQQKRLTTPSCCGPLQTIRGRQPQTPLGRCCAWRRGTPCTAPPGRGCDGIRRGSLTLQSR